MQQSAGVQKVTSWDPGPEVTVRLMWGHGLWRQTGTCVDCWHHHRPENCPDLNVALLRAQAQAAEACYRIRELRERLERRYEGREPIKFEGLYDGMHGDCQEPSLHYHNEEWNSWYASLSTNQQRRLHEVIGLERCTMMEAATQWGTYADLVPATA